MAGSGKAPPLAKPDVEAATGSGGARGGGDGGPPASSGRGPSVGSSEAAEAAPKLPRTVANIIGNEFCERFSFYGMRAVLALYLNQRCQLSESQATEAVHLFIVAVYLFPFLGAFVSDSYLGKYRTILSLSLVYCLGNLVLSFSATRATPAATLDWAVLGLGLLALGTGGIKPCVSAFGGDQIELTNAPGQARDRLVRRFFSYFYFSINLGSTLSTIFTPLLRVNFSFAAAFAVPAGLMIVATLIFWAGRNHYVHQPPGGNVVAQVVSIIFGALAARRRGRRQQGQGGEAERLTSSSGPFGSPVFPPPPTYFGRDTAQQQASNQDEPLVIRRLSTRGSKKVILAPGQVAPPHWLDAAKPEFGEQRVEDVKQLLQVLVLFIPIPIFWSLYDQLASRWIFQAGHMDGRLPGGLVVYPDQMQTLNSVLILALIPLFDQIVYPAVEAMGVSLRPIRRMVLGMLFASLAFVATGLVQMSIDSCPAAPQQPQGIPAASALPFSGGAALSSAPALGVRTLPEAAAPCVSLLWQVPQYVLLTTGEILLSITGLEMAYSQSPSTMASVVTAAWLATDAMGNLVTVLLVGTVTWRLTRSQEFFFFAALCAAAALVLRQLGRGFLYVETTSDMDSEEAQALSS